jgi:hypothetical protein
MTVKELIEKLQAIAVEAGSNVYVENGNGKLAEVELMEARWRADSGHSLRGGSLVKPA